MLTRKSCNPIGGNLYEALEQVHVLQVTRASPAMQGAGHMRLGSSDTYTYIIIHAFTCYKLPYSRKILLEMPELAAFVLQEYFMDFGGKGCHIV